MAAYLWFGKFVVASGSMADQSSIPGVKHTEWVTSLANTLTEKALNYVQCKQPQFALRALSARCYVELDDQSRLWYGFL